MPIPIVFDHLFAVAAGMSWNLVQGNAFSGVGNIDYQVTGLASRYTWETYDAPSSGGGFHLLPCFGVTQARSWPLAPPVESRTL